MTEARHNSQWAGKLRVMAPRVAILAGLLSVAAASCSRDRPAEATASAARPPLAFEDAAPSIDALLDLFVEAVQANDATALHRLRVTEEEYREIIVPWTVEVGQPAREIPEESTTFYWRLLDRKSRDFVRVLLAEHGGRSLEHGEPRYTKGVQLYGGYVARGQVRLPAVDTEGNEVLLRSGTIAEVAGRYKFIGLNWKD